MASSGSFYNTFRTGYTLRVEWKTNSQNISSNTSNVTVTAYLVSGGSSYTINSSASKTVTLVINGIPYSKSESGLANLAGGQKKALFSKTLTISHSTDGTKKLSIYCTFGLNVTLSGTYFGTVRAPASGEWSDSLDTIARPTTPTTSGTFQVGNTVTINTPRAANSFVHTLQYSLNNTTWQDIATNVATSTTWKLPDGLAAAKPSNTTGTVYIRCITYNDGKNLGSKTITRAYGITATFAAPSVSLSVSQKNDGDISGYIRGRSSVTLKASATTKYMATPTKYVFEYGGVEKTVTSTSLSASVTFTLPSNAAASYEYSVVLTDSRGYTASANGTLSTLAYTAPVISSLVVVRGNYDGTEFTDDSKGRNLKITAKGTVTSFSNSNSKNYKIEYRLSNSTTYSTLIDTKDASSYSVNVTEYTGDTGVIFSENASYVIRFTLSDKLDSVSMIYDVPSQRVLLNFSANGKAMAIGGIASVNDALEIMMESYMTGGIKPMQLAAGTDLDEIMKSGFYIANVNDGEMFNTPTVLSSGSFLLEVFNSGDAGQRMQRCMYANKTQYRAYVRFYHSSAWGAWQPAEGFTAFSISDHEGRVRFANGFLIQWGRVSITPSAANTITSKVIQFPLSFSASPVVQVSPNAGVPNYLTCSYSASANELTIHMTRTNTTATWVSWTAVGIG